MEKVFAYQVFIVLLTWVLVRNFISAQRAENGLASEILHGVKQNAKKTDVSVEVWAGIGS